MEAIHLKKGHPHVNQDRSARKVSEAARKEKKVAQKPIKLARKIVIRT